MKPLTPSSPHVIIMTGIPGAGKSYFAEHFAETFQAPYINTASIREHTHSDGAAKSIAEKQLAELLKTKRTLIFDGDAQTKAERKALYEQLDKAGYRPLLIWVQTESGEAGRRAAKSGLSQADFKDAVKAFEVPQTTEKAIVISGKHTHTSQLRVVLRVLSESRPEAASTGRTERERTSRSITLR